MIVYELIASHLLKDDICTKYIKYSSRASGRNISKERHRIVTSLASGSLPFTLVKIEITSFDISITNVSEAPATRVQIDVSYLISTKVSLFDVFLFTVVPLLLSPPPTINHFSSTEIPAWPALGDTTSPWICGWDHSNCNTVEKLSF